MKGEDIIISKIKIVGELAKFAQEQAEAVKHNHQIVELCNGRCISHTSAELAGLVQKNASRIASYGNGHHIAILGEKTFLWCTAYLSVAMTRNTSVLADSSLSAQYLQILFNRTDVDAVIYDSSVADKIKEMKAFGLKFVFEICIDDMLSGLLSSFEAVTDDFERPCEDDVCSIFFTSGTSGNQKAVMLTHRNMISNVAVVSEDCQFRWNNTTMFSMLPFFHVYGLVVELMMPLYLHCDLYLNDSVTHLIENLRIAKPTHIACVPLILKMLKFRILSMAKTKGILAKEAMKLITGGNLQQVICGGAYLDSSYIDAFSEFGLTVRVGYGMTECSPQIATNSISNVKKDSVGKVIRGEEIRIEDSEIWVKGPNVMKGYYKDDEANAEVFSADGWFRTGDLGYMDSEGFLYLTGRKKNLIIMDNGENISPEYYENILSACIAVEEVIVFSENNHLTAEIYPVQSIDKEVASAMIDKCICEENEKLPISRQICRYKFRDIPFPKTATNKILRNSL